MKNKIEDLRNHLFEQLERLKDVEPEKLEKELERAGAVADVARVIVDSAKAEVAFIQATGKITEGTGFVPLPDAPVRPRLGVSAGGGR